MGIVVDIDDIEDFKDAFASARAEAYRKGQVDIIRRIAEKRFGPGSLPPRADAALAGMDGDGLLDTCAALLKAPSVDAVFPEVAAGAG